MSENRSQTKSVASRRERVALIRSVLGSQRYIYHDSKGQPNQFALRTLLRIEALRRSEFNATRFEQWLLEKRHAEPDNTAIDFEHEFEFVEILRTYEGELAKRKLTEPQPNAGHTEPPHTQPTVDTGFWCCSSQLAEAHAVSQSIAQTLKAEPYAKITVLAANITRDSSLLKELLEINQIGWLEHGSYDPFRTSWLRDIAAWAATAIAKEDSSATLRALTTAPVSMPQTDIARCATHARRAKLPLSEAAVALSTEGDLSAIGKVSAQRFHSLLEATKMAITNGDPHNLLRSLTATTNINRDTSDKAAISYLQELLQRFCNYHHSGSSRDFAYFLRELIELDSADDHQPLTSCSRFGTGNVTLRSLFNNQHEDCDYLFLLGADTSRLPKPQHRNFEPLPAGISQIDDKEELRKLNQERAYAQVNLLLSRVRNQATITYSERNSQGTLMKPAKFIEKLREEQRVNWVKRQDEPQQELELKRAVQTLKNCLAEDAERVGQALTQPQLDAGDLIPPTVARWMALIELSALRSFGDDRDSHLNGLGNLLEGSLTKQTKSLMPSSETLANGQLTELVKELAQPGQSLANFLPRHGEGLILSASDIGAYTACPLRYKLSKIVGMPRKSTINQRFGVLIHSVLDRFYTLPEKRTLADLLGLMEQGWQRGGFGSDHNELTLRAKATAALTAYFERYQQDVADPAWRERSFSFQLGEHLLRGRVDRVDQLADGSYELIDYKTGRPRKESDLKDDVQLTLYAIAAQEDWGVESSLQSYYYLLDDVKAAVPTEPNSKERLASVVEAVAQGVLSENFQPTPSFGSCSQCEFHIACPAQER